MGKKKKKFKPVITRVKLNPEQAVLACSCFSTGYMWPGTNEYSTSWCSGKDVMFGGSTSVNAGSTSS